MVLQSHLPAGKKLIAQKKGGSNELSRTMLDPPLNYVAMYHTFATD